MEKNQLMKLIIPNIYQIDGLNAIEEAEKSKDRGIVVLPTGTGKTLLSALWIKKKLEKNKNIRVLFVCHNEDILNQANEQEFKNALRDFDITYGYYTSSEKNIETVTFATVQTLVRNFDKFERYFFDYIIIDECHHYQAKIFKKIGTYFKPKFILSLTATPYKNIKVLHNICGEIIFLRKIGDAIKLNLLSKIKYFWTNNGIDFSNIKFKNNNYDEKDLNRNICVPKYDQAILREYQDFIKGEHNKKKTIGFCSTIKHCYRMEKLFNDNGIKSVALCGKHFRYGKRSSVGKSERKRIVQEFRDGKYDVIFVRDLFNEGVDIPNADCIMMMRNTSSNIIYTQQIGRGLRPGKDYLLIIDFVKNQKKCKINFDVLSDMIGKDIILLVKENVKNNPDYNKEVVIINNGCEIHLTKNEIDIINRNNYHVLRDAIEEFTRFYKNRKPYRWQLGKENQWIYHQFKRNALLDKYCCKRLRTHQDAIEEFNKIYGSNKPTHTQLIGENRWIYESLYKKNLLNKFCKRTNKDLNYHLIKFKDIYKNKKPTLSKLQRENANIYYHLNKHQLLDKYCLPSKLRRLQDAIQDFKKIYGYNKPRIYKLQKENGWIYHHFYKNKLLDKYCLPSWNKKQLKISPFIPKVIVPKQPMQHKGKKDFKYDGQLGYEHKATAQEKDEIRPKIVSKIKENDSVIALESPECSFIKEIEKQGIKPKKVTIPNNREPEKLVNAIIGNGWIIQSNKDGIVELTKENSFPITVINTDAQTWLANTDEKYDFLWLDYCGAFSFYAKDLDIIFGKHFGDMKLILTYNLFDPAKDDENYYFTRVIDYVLEKSGKAKVRLLNDITYRYKKNMYNLGFDIQEFNKCHL